MLLAGALGTLVLAAVCLSAVSGWAAANTLRVAEQDVTPPEVVTVRLPDYQSDRSVRMPDVRGLSRAEAEQTLVDAGIPAELITVEERPAAGPVNSVIQQSPVFGTPSPSLVHLVTSLEATVPEAVGRPAAEVIVDLQNLGARIIQVRDYVPGVAAGEVVSVNPEPGKPVPAEVRLVVGDSPISRPLADRDTLDGHASTSTDTVQGGVRFDTSVSLSVREDSESTAWDLGGEFAELTGQLALDSESSETGAALVIVRGDGKEIARLTLSSASPQDFSWAVRGVQTLSIERMRQGKEDAPEIRLLDPVLLGSAGGSQDTE